MSHLHPMDERPELWAPLNHFVKMHNSYFTLFREAVDLMFYGDGPLPFYVRHYLAIMAACRHRCPYLVHVHREEFLRHMGPESWLDGLHNASQKIRDLDVTNRLLAHRPWLLQLAHLKKLASSPNNWSLCEIVQGSLILSHTHALCSFINGCGIKMDGYGFVKRVLSPSNSVAAPVNGQRLFDYSLSQLYRSSPSNGRKTSTNVENSVAVSSSSSSSSPTSAAPAATATAGSTNGCTVNGNNNNGRLTKCKSFAAGTNGSSDGSSSGDDNVEKLVACLNLLNNASAAERSQEDKLKLFIDMNRQNCDVADCSTTKDLEEKLGSARQNDIPWSLFTEDLNFNYSEFYRKLENSSNPTFTIHDYSWGDQGYSVMSELYSQISNVIDDKFKFIQDLTYHTMGGHKNIDTTKYRTAVWNYIQSLFGIRHDDYDYSETNKLLSRAMKTYVKTLCCYPERMRDLLRDNVMVDFLLSEKVHVNLMIFEARFQAEVLYLLKTVLRLLT